MVITFVLAFLVLIMLVYVLMLKKQIRTINRLIEKRIHKYTNQIISIEMMDSDINKLAANINNSLKAEQELRLKVVRDENDFKDLIANISHDLRTPLTAIKGYIQLIVKECSDEDELNRLDIVQRHVEELGELIDRFYEYVFLLDVKPEIHVEKINLSNIVTECFAAIVPQLEVKNIELSVDESNVWIYSDKNMTMRIVQNLVRNCLIHAQRWIKIQYNSRNCIELHILNGINEGEIIDINHIFDRFYVVDSSRQSTGLGLSIVKILAELTDAETGACLNEDGIDIYVKWNKNS